MIWTVMEAALAGAAKLRATVISSCWYITFVPYVITKIIHDASQVNFLAYPCRLLVEIAVLYGQVMHVQFPEKR
jgi:hypothetical protein